MKITCKKTGKLNEINIEGVNELSFFDTQNFECWLVNFYGNGNAARGEEICLNLGNIYAMDPRAYDVFLRAAKLNDAGGHGKLYLKGVHGEVESQFGMNPGDYRKFSFI